MVGRKTPHPKEDVHVLIPGIYKCVTLHSKRNFADVIKFKGVKMGKLLCIIWVESQKLEILTQEKF